MNSSRIERKLIPAICFAVVLAISACFGVSQAWAATNVNLQVGQYTKVGSFDFGDECNSKTIYENGQPIDVCNEIQSVWIENTDSKVVAAVKESFDSNCWFWIKAFGKKAGSATLTVRAKKLVTYRYWSGDVKTKTEYSDIAVYNVNVGKSGYLKRSACDGLFKSKKYSIGMLMRNSAYDFRHELDGDDYSVGSVTLPSVISGGKFVTGKGYKVYSKGKKIKFTKTGKVVVKYKVGKTTYKITCAKVHSLSGFKKAAKREIENYLLRPSTIKVKKYKWHWNSKNGTYYLKVKYSEKNAWGDRETDTCAVWYDDGDVMSEYQEAELEEQSN